MNKRRLLLFIIDTLIFVAVFAFLASFIQISSELRILSLRQAALHCGVMLACVFLMRIFFGLYVQIWRYANVRDYLNLIVADFFGGLIYLAIDRSMLVGSHLMVASSIAIVCSVLIASLSARFIYQRLHYYINKRQASEAANRVNVLVVGAGRLGTALVQDLQANPAGRYKPYCFIDSNPDKIGSKVCGLHVYGEGQDVVARVQSLPVQEIIIAIDSLSPEELQALHSRYRQTGCPVKIYAHPLEGTDKGEGKPRVREIRIEDLLYRDAVDLSDESISAYYRDKVVLITGGGGSIGSELARQIAKMGPRQLVIFDIYENNANDIQQELSRLYGNALDVQVEIASVRDARRVEQLFAAYRPAIVFHAAAHKHVHLMEHCPQAAIKNNVLGTWNVAQAAERAGVERFILISTDKAVNPTNIMGATKRITELIVQYYARHSDMRCMTVRFGNVLGSFGSVVPLFENQIKAGGPVQVTHPDITRYFMTIPEAAQLVLQAGAFGESGAIYVLNMGEPVRIMELAERLIRYHGYTPNEDIPIEIIGLRPGEKMYEELTLDEEEQSMLETTHNRIMKAKPLVIDDAAFPDKLNELIGAVGLGEEKVVGLIREMVPNYTGNPNGH